MSPDLSLCIVNHRTPQLTQQCLRSIAETAEGLAVEVLLVNNTLDDQDELRSCLTSFTSSQFLQNEAQCGFSANQNQMLRRTQGRYLMPLNSDAIVQPGALRELVRFMDDHSHIGMAGPKLIHADGQLQPSCRNFPNPATHFLEASGLWQLLRGGFIGRWYYLCSLHTAVQEVDWLTGACLIVRAEAAQQVGFYDEALFPGLYGEDLEWCWRMKRAGWQIMFDPHAVVMHLENQSPMNDRLVQMYFGFYTFCAHCLSHPQQHAIRLTTWLALWPKWFLARSPKTRALYAAVMALPMPTLSARH